MLLAYGASYPFESPSRPQLYRKFHPVRHGAAYIIDEAN